MGTTLRLEPVGTVVTEKRRGHSAAVGEVGCASGDPPQKREINHGDKGIAGTA